MSASLRLSQATNAAWSVFANHAFAVTTRSGSSPHVSAVGSCAEARPLSSTPGSHCITTVTQATTIIQGRRRTSDASSNASAAAPTCQRKCANNSKGQPSGASNAASEAAAVPMSAMLTARDQAARDRRMSTTAATPR